MSQDPHADLSPVKRALLEMRAMRARIDELEQSHREPVAIVGVGLRLPGNISTPDAYWQLLIDGIDAVGDVPRERWDADSYHDPDHDAAGKIATRCGGFLDRIDEFDAAFFGITPREAVSMDPQQRLLLEVAWEALERAGQAPDQLAGSSTGVFVGLSATDYLTTELKFLDAANIDPYLATGGHPSVAAGRVSYALGLQGPSMTVDTACSSSLTAVHLAVQSIRMGECTMALAGGVNLMLLPELSVGLSRARMLAPDGRCKTFDARANGFVRSEGCALIVLKRLRDALRDGDRIMAVIKGSAVNQDGRSSGLTVPNGPAQEAVIRQALTRAAMTPDQIDYVEAHGTGTELGDPVELRALGSVFGARRGRGRRLRVGSVKTNIGHVEAAAGVAGLIKVALALEHGVIPPHLHLATPTPHVDWDALAIEVPTTATAWPRTAEPRHAGVSAFGFGGTNAHVVLGEAPITVRAVAAQRPAHVLTVSAKTDEALLAAACDLAQCITDHPERWPDICHTMNVGRAQLPHRAAVVASSAAAVRQSLEAFAAGTPSPLVRGTTHPSRRPEVAFLFCGQGYEQPGMGQELFDSQPVFRRALERCDELLRPQLDASLLSLLYGADQARLHEPRYTQPVLFAFGYALAELWRSWGVEPAFVAGHSLGEDIAACVAGVFTLEHGLAMMAARARLMHDSLPEGAMAAVFAPVEQVERTLQRIGSEASIAAINGREHVVIAGTPGAIAAAAGVCEQSGLKVRTVAVPRACHSPAMEPVLDDVERLARGMTLSAPRLAFASTLTGRMAGAAELTNPAYWRRHVRETVRFADALHALHAAGARIFVEIGPNGSLTSMGRRALDAADTAWLPSLKRDGRDWEHILTALSELYVRGVPIDWRAVDAGFSFTKVDAPTYPFQRQRYWSDAVQPRHATRNAAADCLYELSWRAVAATPDGAEAPGRVWIVADAGGVGETLARRLRSRNIDAMLLQGRAGFADAVARRQAMADAVVVLHGLDLTVAEEAVGAEIQRRIVAHCDALVGIVRTLVSDSAASPPRVILATAGAQAIDSARVSVGQAPLAALAAVVGAEHPDLQCASVDLEAGSGADAAADALLSEILSGDRRETRVAWRSGRRYGARLTSRPATADAELDVRADATYLITGGAGGLGLHVADDLVARGARHLVLVGRRTISDALETRRLAWAAQGCNAIYLPGDIADGAFIDQLVARVARSMPPIAGVFHTAGVLDDGVLLQQTAERFDRVMAAKVAGTWNLHRAFGNSLDFLVMFSSLAGVVGTPGQGNYAAANAFLDAVAEERRRLGWRATSIAWGPWDESGMAASISAGGHRRWETQGVNRIDVARGLSLLRRASGAESKPTVIVADVNWQAYVGTRPPGTQPRLFDELVSDPAAQSPSPSPTPAPGQFESHLRSLGHADRLAEVMKVIRGALSQVLGLRPDDRVDPRQGLQDFGVDSLMALELRNLLQHTTGRSLPATFVFDYPSIEAMAGYLVRAVAGSAAEAAPVSAPPDDVGRSPANEPIAIVGIGCRFPGADSPAAFWRLLRNGVDAISEVPHERWSLDDYHDPDAAVAGKMVSRYGGFVKGIEQFDPQFFGIAPREAATMDPQQRLLLEVAWEALEHAALPPDALHGTRTGVYVGVSSTDYFQLQLRRTAVADLQPHVATGGASSVAAGRVAYGLGLQGPAMVVDTACSSSLVAIHLACQSLRHGDCETALAGGVNAVLTPEGNVILSRARMLSPDGRCKTFDAAADGYVRSEGCGIVVLKRLGDAVAAGDRVLAVIRGTAVNQDGRSGGLTVPNGPAQESLVRDALRSASLQPGDIDYVEAHGTGTSLGDPIEVRALANVFAEGRDPSRPLLLGSVKTNLGHLEPAAGVAGLIKVVLSMQGGEIPPHLHLHSVNPLIALDAIPAAIPTTVTPWASGERPRRAGVSSFGFSGTNAHAVIEEAPAPPPATVADRSHHVLALSAKTPAALRDLTEQYLQHLDQTTDPLADIASTANAGRSHFEHRLAVVGATISEVRQSLAVRVAAITDDEPAAPPRVAFVFSGDGGSSCTAARELYESQAAFRRAIDQCAQLFEDDLPHALIDLLFKEHLSAGNGDGPLVRDARVFAVEYALAELWRAWGVQPSASIGRGVGAIVAACTAGSLTLEDARRRIIAGATLPDEAFDATAQRMRALVTGEGHVFLEIGANPTASESCGPGLVDHRVTWLPTLRQGRGHWRQLMETVAALYELSVPLDWQAVERTGAQRRIVTLPTYPFQRARYWIADAPAATEDAREPVTSLQRRPGAAGDSGSWHTDNAYSVVWKASGAPPWAGAPGIGQLSEPGAVADAVQSHVPALAAAADMSRYRTTIAALERLSTAYIVDALQRMGWTFEVGEQIDPMAVADRLRVRHTQRPLLARILSYLAEDGILVRDGAAYRVTGGLPATELDARRQELRETGDAANELTFLTRCGERLAEVLRGDVSGVEVVFPRAGFDVAEAVYTESAIARFYNAMVRRSVETIVSSLPVDRLIRVLEVGAGTGSTTAAVLPILPPGRTRYVYTDVSPAFLHRAQEKFAGFDFVEYKTFDVERAGTAQGFNPGQFDLVIAANVLHATRDLRRTVDHVRELVADHGLVLFAEATQPRRWLDITFGLTDGWWLFEDRHLRPEQPLLSRADWLALLSSTGFELPRALPDAAGDELLTTNSLLLARAVAAPATPATAGTWMVLVDDGGFGSHVAEAVLAGGARCIEVRVGTTLAADGIDRFRTDPHDRDGFAQLFSRLDHAELRGVINCWPLDAPALDAASAETLAASHARSCGSVLFVAQALTAAATPPALWVITRDACAVVNGDTVRGAAQSSAWGIGRVVALEHPDVWGGLIDIEAGDPVSMAARVVAAIQSADGEDQIALRRDGRHVARLAVAAPMPRTAPVLQRDATYLITGGMGGVGRRIASEMARQGAGHLVLMSRSEPSSAEQLATLREIEAMGTRVTSWRGDVAVRGDMERLRAELPSWPPLRGVVHAASYIHAGRLRDLRWDDVLTMLRPKVEGTWLLDEATRDAALDFFVVMSSTAGVFGARSLAHYAAANVFLDAFAHARRRDGAPVTSVSWGTWEVIRGSAAAQQEIDRGGLKIMPAAVTLEAFLQLLHSPHAHVVFAHVDWPTLKPLYEARRRRPFFAEVGQTAVTPPTSGVPSSTQLHGALQAARPAERRPLLQSQIRAVAAEVLGLAPAQVDPRKGLFDLGMDSLMSVDLKNRLEKTLGRTLPSTLTFNYPSVAAITDYVAGDILGLNLGETETAAAVVEALVPVPVGAPEDDDDLSEEELVSELAARLRAIPS
jgi:acyl transferase domain-containing protein/acyl carrier protein/SAM-dependent methyltransferase